MKTTILLITSLILVGCGSGSGDTYNTDEPIYEPTTIPENTDAIIVQGGTYIDVDGDYVVIYCEGGECVTNTGVLTTETSHTNPEPEVETGETE